VVAQGKVVVKGEGGAEGGTQVFVLSNQYPKMRRQADLGFESLNLLTSCGELRMGIGSSGGSGSS